MTIERLDELLEKALKENDPEVARQVLHQLARVGSNDDAMMGIAEDMVSICQREPRISDKLFLEAVGLREMMGKDSAAKDRDFAERMLPVQLAYADAQYKAEDHKLPMGQVNPATTKVLEAREACDGVLATRFPKQGNRTTAPQVAAGVVL